MNRPLCHYLLILLPIILFSEGTLPVQAWYIGTEEFAAATFSDDLLSHYNYAADSNDANLTPTDIEPNSNLRPIISLELTNLNCREGKSYPTYYRNKSGEKITHKVSRPVWGVVWGYRDIHNYHAILLRTGESDPQGYNPPTLQYCIFTVAEGDTLLHTPWRNTPERYLNPESEFNHLLISPVDGGFEIAIGAAHEYRLGICADDRLFGNQAGIYIGSGANIAMRKWNVSPKRYIERMPFMTKEEIANHLNQTANPYEGIYEVIFASSASSNIRLGGNYRLAFIRVDNHYKLLYLEGAQRAADLWKPGMVKASLQPIAGDEVFQVSWLDANHNPFFDETKATLSPEKLEIIFPTSATKLTLIKLSPDTQEKGEGIFRLL